MMDMISSGQIVALGRLLDYPHDERMFVVEKLIGRRVEKLSELTRNEWYAIRNKAYEDWRADDWTVSRAFRAKVMGLREEYAESQLGQMRMF